VVLKVRSLKESLFLKAIRQKNLQKNFANATTSTKKQKSDLSNFFYNKLLQSLLRSRKRVKVITTLLGKITTTTTKKRMTMIGKLILLREVRWLLSLTNMAATLIVNFLNYNCTPTTITLKMAISEKEKSIRERMFVC